MHILNSFEAVYKSHVLSLVKTGLECGVYTKNFKYKYIRTEGDDCKLVSMT